LELHKSEIEHAGLRVVSVGIGKVEDAASACGRLAPSIICLTHPGLDAHEAYRLKMSTLGRLSGSLVAVPRAMARGHMQGRATTDIRGTRMLGGVFVFDRGGIIRYAAYNEHAGDHPPIADVLAAAQKL